MSFLTISGVTKNFGANTVVKGFDLAIDRGEFVTFLGPSGCGKTTVLRMVAGFEQPSSGKIVVDGKNITELAPNLRRIGMVFQAYALFPNMNVFGNVAFGLKIAGMAKPEIEARVGEMLRLIGLEHLADRYPYQMSGGQQQRVALARALLLKPQWLFLDEATASLDPGAERQLYETLARQLPNATILSIAHRPAVAEHHRRHIILRDGDLVEA